MSVRCRKCGARIDFFPVRKDDGFVAYLPVNAGTAYSHSDECRKRQAARRASRWSDPDSHSTVRQSGSLQGSGGLRPTGPMQNSAAEDEVPR